MPWHSINYATIFVLNYATKPGILAPLSRQSLFGHPGPTFARITHFPITDAVCPPNQHPIAIINEFCYRLFSLFFPSLILLSHSVIILLLLFFLPPSFLSFSESGTEEEKNLQFQLSHSMPLTDPSPRKIRFPPRGK